MKQKKATLKYKSPVEDWTAGRVLTFKNWAEVKGPRNGRTVIKGVSIHAELSVTGTVGTMAGEDLYRFVERFSLQQKDGIRRFNEIPGDQLRVISYAHAGGDRTHEHADFAVGGPTTINFSAYVPLQKQFVHGPNDFCLPVDLLDWITVTCPTATSMSIGGATFTINSGRYWVIVECYEEMAVVDYSVDEWRVRTFANVGALQLELITGGRLHDAYVHIRGADGGQTLANLTDARFEHIMPQALLRDPDLMQHYARERGVALGLASTTGNPMRLDPFIAATGGVQRACAILLASGHKVYEAPERDNVNLVVTLAGDLPAIASVIYRVVIKKSERTRAGLFRNFKLTGASRVKAEGKTGRDPAGWQNKHLAYLPEKLATRKSK